MPIQGKVNFPPAIQLPNLPANATTEQLHTHLRNLHTSIQILHKNTYVALASMQSTVNGISVVASGGATLLIGLDANKPLSGFNSNRIYFATDTGKGYIDTGSVWQVIFGAAAT